MRRQCGHCRVLILSVGLLMLAAPGWADLFVSSVGLGSEMAGGTLTVTFASAGSITVPITASSTAGVASGTGFTFSVTGDTFTHAWILANTSASDTILSALFDLTGSISLFDTTPPATVCTGTPPSYTCGTWASDIGRPGAYSLSGPTITSSAEVIASSWQDSANRGDMFLQEQINYSGFTHGLVATWADDTDIWVTPEPASILLIGGGLVALALRRRRAKAD